MESEDGSARPRDASNVLVLCRSGDSMDSRCADLFSPDPSIDASVVSVVYTEPPDGRLAAASSAGETPGEARVIAVGDGANSAAIQSIGAPVTTVEHPADLTELGIRLGAAVDQLSGEELLVCFHSLTALLEHAAVQRTFRFLHVMTAKLATEGVTAHYHLDPAPVDEGTVATLRPLFDHVVSDTG